MVVIVVVVMVVIVMIVLMVMIVIVIARRLEEGRLDIEDAVEVEGVAAEHLIERNLRSARSCAAWRKD